MDAATPQRMEEGRAHFNAHRFFEAHEVWEQAWLVEMGSTRLLLQGLIQIAAGYLKAVGRAPRPCARLLESGLEKLISAASGDPALAAFAARVRANLDEVRRWGRGETAGLSESPVLPPLPGTRP